MSKKGDVRVLVIDDEESIRKMLRVCLEGAGYGVTLAPTGESGVAAAGDEAELCVRDRGPGLPPEVEARLFDRDGGPGLFLAREIVEAHGGRIAVDSAPGHGSTFTISLPVHEGEERT